MFYRICPECKKEIEYKTKRSRDYAIKKARPCLKCVRNKPEFKEQVSKRCKGKKRIFSKEWRNNIGKAGIGRKFSDETIVKRAATRAGMSVEEYQNMIPEYEKYRRKVRRITNQQPLHTLKNYDKRGRKTYHLDHKISIAEGFRKNISSKTIGHISNLQMLPWIENIKKSDKN